MRRGLYDKAAKNTIPLEVEITEGPRVQLVVTGAKLSQGTLKKLVPIYQEGSVDVDLLEEGKRNIRERLERDGYFDAGVEYTTVTQRRAAERQLEGHGRNHHLQSRTRRPPQTGSASKSPGTITSTPNCCAAGFRFMAKAFATRGRFSRRLVESDRDSLQSLYQSNGFLDRPRSMRRRSTITKASKASFSFAT